MSLGQVSEILTMLVLGIVLKKLGWRLTMLIGILGHAGRFAVYAFFASEPWMIVTVQILHGICYAFFFATVYIFVDTYFPKDVRSSAQGLFNMMILGLGVLAANTLGPWLIQSVFTADGVTDFRSTVPAAVPDRAGRGHRPGRGLPAAGPGPGRARMRGDRPDPGDPGIRGIIVRGRIAARP